MKGMITVSIFFIFSIQQVFSQVSVQSVDYPTLENIFKQRDDTLRVVNFWATWCAPCIKELPHFREASEKFQGEKIRFYFVSLDFEKSKAKAEEVLINKGLEGIHYLLTGDPNVWIDQIDTEWQGNIPYTLIVQRNGTYVKAPYAFQSVEQLINLINQHKNIH